MDLRELQKAYLDNLRRVTEDKLEMGTLIRTIISIDDGLILKDGRTQKPKKLVIVGVDKMKEGSMFKEKKDNSCPPTITSYIPWEKTRR